MATIKTLSVDVECFCKAPLPSVGVYRYSEDPSFEITLFGYSIDDGPVQVVDLINGEKIPDEVFNALTDDTVTKWAYNAGFERVCLSRYLGLPSGTYLNPASWRCTLVWAATLGLPLSLEGAGAVLSLDKQKLSEGKDLIKYFCIPCAPTKANGGRDRNLPKDNPEKWELFKAYNKRDVETEMGIKAKLAHHPVPEFVWDEYHIDQEINDRGVRVDRTLVSSAIALDEVSKSELMSSIKDITQLENPNSVAQLKSWLSENGLEAESLGKKCVEALIQTAPENIRDALALRQMLAKSSVKKYQAMRECMCRDERVHGMFQFYGANRTGRWCLTGDHEVLTDGGWVRLDEWKGGAIACWTPAGELVSFQKSEALSFDYTGEMYTLEDKRIFQTSTPEHKMYAKQRYGGEWCTDTVENLSKHRLCIPFTGYRLVHTSLENEKLRVLVMVQADGHYTPSGDIKLGFTKERKAERCKSLLRAADILFKSDVYVNNPKPRFQFTICARDVPLWLREFESKTFGTWLFDMSPDVFFDELVYWDGYRSAANSIQYSTVNKTNADMVQAFAHISGRSAQLKIKSRSAEHPNWKDAYVLDIWLTPINCHEIRSKCVVTEYSGKVYCAKTPTGFFLVRRNGRVWVTGNSGRLVQMQNLPQNHLPDLAEARALVKAGDYEAVKLLYEDVPDTLSQLIRTAFIPRDGSRFIVADFSAIEARVIAWYAGEKWRNDLFARGGDIYCQSASEMFGVPVEKHGVNGHLRQKGKIAELACIAEGSPVLTDHGLVPIEKVTKEMLLWDGESWVSHGGVIYKGTREVITYEGLTATPDHLVWVYGKQEPIQLGVAARSGYDLLRVERYTGCKGILRGKASKVYDIRDAGPNHRFTVSDCLVHNCGYGGGVGAMINMGALDMGLDESELSEIVTRWRQSSPNIVTFWWDVDKAAKKAIKERTIVRLHHGLVFEYKGSMLYVTLPSGRKLAYVKPQIGFNVYGSESITYEGTGNAKKWERLETYGPKLVENIVQATARDILAYAMKNLRDKAIVMHIHDELVIEAGPGDTLDGISSVMGQTPPWAEGLILRADGYECEFYKKD